jgi:hypothetical protein
MPRLFIHVLNSRDSFHPKCRKHMFFCGEMIEEGAFADVRRFGDVFDSGLKISALGEKAQGRAVEPLADFRATPLAAADGAGSRD